MVVLFVAENTNRPSNRVNFEKGVTFACSVYTEQRQPYILLLLISFPKIAIVALRDGAEKVSSLDSYI